MYIKPLHIGFLTPEYPTEQSPSGGLGNYIQRVGHMLSQRGHRISVVWLSRRNAMWIDNALNIYEIRRPGLVPFSRYIGGERLEQLVYHYALRGTYAPLRQLRAAYHVEKAVWRIHKIQPFDLLQSSSSSTPGLTLRHNKKVPLVCRVSSYRPLWRSANGHQRSFSNMLCDWLEVKQVLEADASFAPSRLLQQVYATVEGYPKLDLIRTPYDLPNTVRVDQSFYRKELQGKKYLLFFGRLSRLKGVDLLGDVLPSLLSRHRDLSFVLIGKDSENPEKKMLPVIFKKCSGLEDRVLSFEPLPKEQLFPVIKNSLAVVLPSRVDNYPNACLEAQALGKPVIATRQSSLDEIVCDGQTGFLVENGSAVSLEGAIERLLSLTVSEIEQMKASVIAHVARMATSDDLGKLELFYRNVINDYHNSPK